MKEALKRLAGLYFLLDGFLTFFLGRIYVRLFHFGKPGHPYEKMIGSLLDLPSWTLRAAGGSEFLLGLTILRRAPIEVQTLYRLIAPGYAAIDPKWRQWLYPKAHFDFDQFLVENLDLGGDVLDLGCGVGANLARIHSLRLPFTSYTGVDLSNDMLKYARRKFGEGSKVDFLQLDLTSEPFPEGPFDLIISTWAFEHLSDPVRVAEKAWEQLKPGGHMAFLFEAESSSFYSRVLNWVYPLISVRLIPVREYQRFPARMVLESHFWGPLGDLTLLVLEKEE